MNPHVQKPTRKLQMSKQNEQKERKKIYTVKKRLSTACNEWTSRAAIGIEEPEIPINY
jgi:uroporphyrinogen-III decarboxylase